MPELIEKRRCPLCNVTKIISHHGDETLWEHEADCPANPDRAESADGQPKPTKDDSP